MDSYSTIKNSLNKLKHDAYEQIGEQEKPSMLTSMGSFGKQAANSLYFILTEKENIMFAVLQLVCIVLGYYIWVQALSWIPDEVWQATQENKEGTFVNILLWLWSFSCVGLVSLPLGLLTACMSASYILRSEGKESTVAECLKVALPKAWPIWVFSWIDGWWTVLRIMERLPKKNDRTPLSTKLRNEIVYNAWKAASLGFIPALLFGRGAVEAGRDSVRLLVDRFMPLIKLRLAYALICWIVGIGSYIGIFFIGRYIFNAMQSEYDMYTFYFYCGVPMIMALLIIMLIFRPLYIISACRIYTGYAHSQGIKAELPQSSPKFVSVTVAFAVLAVVIGVLLLYHTELGIDERIVAPILNK